MNITIADHSGYCYGVTRAMSMLDRAAARNAGTIYLLGEIIHNPRIIAGLRKIGIVTLKDESCDFPPDSVAVLPTHGATPRAANELKAGGANILDATCPRVLAVHKRITAALADGRSIIIAGDPAHAEVSVFRALCGDKCRVVDSPEQAKKLRGPSGRPVFLTAQTTFSPAMFDAIEDEIRARADDVAVFRSLCGHTLKAQSATARLARRSDKMIVIGGRNSSNTARLREAAERTGAATFHIERASELRKRDFSQTDHVGITAGASTPPEQVQEVVDWLAKRFPL